MKKVLLTLVFAFVATIATVKAQTPIKYDTTALKVYVGTYNIASEGLRSKLIIKNGKLISIGGDEDYELAPTAKEHVFVIGEGAITVTFLVDDKKIITKATVKTNDGQEFEVTKEKQ